jgi:hypothetical protein
MRSVNGVTTDRCLRHLVIGWVERWTIGTPQPECPVTYLKAIRITGMKARRWPKGIVEEMQLKV